MQKQVPKKDREFLDWVKTQPCLIRSCRKRPSDPDHLKTRGAGGGDEHFNVLNLCREHHTERHAIGLSVFAAKYFDVTAALNERGWVYDEFTKRWMRGAA